MAIVATARATGGGAILLPNGCLSIEDMPWDLARAVDHATKILGWRENLMPDDFPPEWMLPFEEELTEWFEQVKARHESESGSEEAGMEKNELAAGIR